jgi:hypothetical protein
VARRAAVEGNTLYVSWNGSTEVATWEVLAGDDAGQLASVGRTTWAGLETAIPLSTTASVVAVRALDAAGRVLATSETVDR